MMLEDSGEDVDDDAWLEEYHLVFSAKREEFKQRIEMREGDYLSRLSDTKGLLFLSDIAPALGTGEVPNGGDSVGLTPSRKELNITDVIRGLRKETVRWLRGEFLVVWTRQNGERLGASR